MRRYLFIMIILYGIMAILGLGCVSPLYAQTCGNNKTEPGEACDCSDLNGYDCASVAAGFVSGTLSCKADCSGYDISQCVPGNTIYAGDCSWEAVKAAIDKASDGDTVFIPEGTCDWSQRMIIDPMPAIIIHGAGMNKTVIRNINYGFPDGIFSANYPDGLLDFKSVEGKPFRLTGITFQGTDKMNNGGHATINMNRYCKNWRIDHCRFDELFMHGIKISLWNYGVIDHCDFINITDQCILIKHNDWGGDDYFYGDGSRIEGPTYGTVKAVYIEDCHFEDNSPEAALDTKAGSRVVFRYNTLINAITAGHGFEGGRDRAAYTYEIYGNTFTLNSGTSPSAIGFRDGTGIVYDNTVKGNYSYMINVSNYRSHKGNGSCYHCKDCPSQYTSAWRCGPSDACDGDSIYDGNFAADSGTYTGGNDPSILTVSGKTWLENKWVGYMVKKKDSEGVVVRKGFITANDKNTIIAGCCELDWDEGDEFQIVDQDGNPILYEDGNPMKGTHKGPDDSMILIIDTPQPEWEDNKLAGLIIKNLTDQSWMGIGTSSSSKINGRFYIENCECKFTWENGDSFEITNGYPCLDQPGRGQDSGFRTPQALEPIFEWNNTFNGMNGDIYSGTEYIQKGRDFYNDTVTYDKVTGMYKAEYTDDDGSIKSWSYTPYVYPHPLVTAEVDTISPSLSNGKPSGSLPSGTTETIISLETNEEATCKYSTTSGTDYSSMPYNFISTGLKQHSTLVTGLEDGKTYTYYVRCNDKSNNSNTNDFPLTFSVNAIDVHLNIPLDGFNSNINDVNLNCSAYSSSSDITDITLYTNISGWNSETTATASVNHTIHDIPDGAYEWNCKACNNEGNCNWNNNNYTFTIDTTPPVIPDVESSPLSISAVISWQTNEPADSVVKYGATPGVYPEIKKVSDDVTDHSVILTDLKNNVEYNYVVVSTDATGNSTQSPEYSFSTTDDTGLLLYFQFNEGSGNTAFDSSGNGNDVNFDSPTWVEGIDGFALSFDGLDDYLSVNNISGHIAGKNFTVSLWINTSSISSPTSEIIVSVNTESNGSKFMFGHQQNNSVIGIYDKGWHNGTNNVIDCEWHQVAYVLDDTNNQMTVYVDGSAEFNYTTTTSVVASDLFSLGKSTGSGLFFNGVMDEVRVYDKALTAGEILGIYATTLPPTLPAPSNLRVIGVKASSL